MTKIETWLVEHVYQRLADLCMNWTGRSCYWLAAQCMWAGYGILMARIVTSDDGLFLTILCGIMGAAWCCLFNYLCQRAERQAEKAGASPQTPGTVFDRSLWLGLTTGDALIFVLTGNLWGFLARLASDLLILSGFFFVLCRMNPPKRRRATNLVHEGAGA